MLGNQRPQLGHQVGMAVERKVAFDPRFERSHAELFESHDRVLRERLVPKLREGRPAPERERLAEDPSRLGPITVGERAPALLELVLEAIHIALTAVELYDVAASACLKNRVRAVGDGAGSQGLAQLKDVQLYVLRSRGRRRVTPQRIDQAIA